jgi:hypothetical protein
MRVKSMGMVSLILMCLVCHANLGIAADKLVAGWVETVALHPGNLKLKAKLDTGAENSSLNARHIEYFTRDNATWVRFDVRNFNGRIETFEAMVTRNAQIKRHGGKTVDRPVITLGICLGSTYKEVEVNLTDRTGFNYQMLIGRSFLSGSFVVDPEATFLSQPHCNSREDQ